jgi:dipicolinate synthase subunit B
LSGGSAVTLPQAEPLGPKNLLDVFVIAPCTGNTLAKLAAGITDTPASKTVTTGSAEV